MTKAKTTKTPTAMLVINSKDNVTEGRDAVLAVLSVKGHEPTTYQEALRTLAIVGKPPQNVTVTDCSFRS